MEQNDNEESYDVFVNKIAGLIEQMKPLYDQAVVAYTPIVEDLCRKNATENEVGWTLDWLLMFAGDNRMLNLYKKVCRRYWRIYPETIASYIMDYRKEYDPESLVGTKYEYLLHENDSDDD